MRFSNARITQLRYAKLCQIKDHYCSIHNRMSVLEAILKLID